MTENDSPGVEDNHEDSWIRERAKWEYDLWKKYGRPSQPFYLKCTNCGEVYEIEGHLEAADYSARRHAGVHGGLDEEHAELIVMDSTGREVFRHHALHTPESQPDVCPECGETADSDQVVCPHCGHVSEEAVA